MKLKNVDLTRPLDTKITEFLMAFGYSLQNQIRKDTPGQREQKFDPIMPTLFLLENEDMRQANLIAPTPLANMNDIFKALFERTKNYYASLSFIKTPIIQTANNTHSASIDLSIYNNNLAKPSLPHQLTPSTRAMNPIQSSGSAIFG